MKNYFYLVWGDALNGVKKHHKTDWKAKAFIYVTVSNAMNVAVLTLWLKEFDLFVYPFIFIDTELLDSVDAAISFVLNFIVPIGIINYFLIFFNGREQKIMNHYKPSKPYSFYYAMLSLLVWIVSFFIILIIKGIKQWLF